MASGQIEFDLQGGKGVYRQKGADTWIPFKSTKIIKLGSNTTGPLKGKITPEFLGMPDSIFDPQKYSSNNFFCKPVTLNTDNRFTPPGGSVNLNVTYNKDTGDYTLPAICQYRDGVGFSVTCTAYWYFCTEAVPE